jgi:hypothetical protein
MTEDEVIAVMRRHLENKFPKKCPVCARTYADLKDYLLHTTHLGRPLSYDAELGIYRPAKPLGTMSMANCSCGTTLSISSEGMSLMTMWKLMRWLRRETKRRRQTASVILEELRNSIDRATLSDPPLPAVIEAR